MGKTYIFIYYVLPVIVFTAARRHIFDSQHLNLEFIEMQRSFGKWRRAEDALNVLLCPLASNRYECSVKAQSAPLGTGRNGDQSSASVAPKA